MGSSATSPAPGEDKAVSASQSAAQCPGPLEPLVQRSIPGHQLLRWRREKLQLGGSPTELDWLLDLAGGVRWNTLQRLLLSPDQPVELDAPLETIEAIWQRHLHHGEPLQYMVGRCPWRDLELEVGPEVLIPRQETELLVELAMQLTGSEREGQGPALWADLGTGSGCLAAALAKAWPSSQGLAVDISSEALAIARRNLERLGLQSQVMLSQGSWWEPVRAHWGELTLVVANPPYIPDAVWRELDPVVRENEPSLALSSGADGLDAIRAIAADGAKALAPGGWLLLEHHHDQSQAVLQLLERFGLESAGAHADLEGKARFASARRPSEAESAS